MNNKEIYLKFITDFNGIGIVDILNSLNMDPASFYTRRYSLYNMQRVTNEMRRQLKNLVIELNDNHFVLDTKEKNVEFVKDIKDIRTKYICKDLKVDESNMYSCTASEKKYELVINEIKRQLIEVYNKYNENN